MVRDVTFDEDRSQVRTGAAPQVMAALRNAVIGLLRRTGSQNIAAALRRYSWNPTASLSLLGSPIPNYMKGPGTRSLSCREMDVMGLFFPWWVYLSEDEAIEVARSFK